jgi:hypothetical protein
MRVSKEHEYETKIDLSIGQVVSAAWMATLTAGSR